MSPRLFTRCCCCCCRLYPAVRCCLLLRVAHPDSTCWIRHTLAEPTANWASNICHLLSAFFFLCDWWFKPVASRTVWQKKKLVSPFVIDTSHLNMRRQHLQHTQKCEPAHTHPQPCVNLLLWGRWAQFVYRDLTAGAVSQTNTLWQAYYVHMRAQRTHVRRAHPVVWQLLGVAAKPPASAASGGQSRSLHLPLLLLAGSALHNLSAPLLLRLSVWSAKPTAKIIIRRHKHTHHI